jgi:hypothetical protein
VEGRAEDQESHPWRAGSDLLGGGPRPLARTSFRALDHMAVPGHNRPRAAPQVKRKDSVVCRSDGGAAVRSYVRRSRGVALRGCATTRFGHRRGSGPGPRRWSQPAGLVSAAQSAISCTGYRFGRRRRPPERKCVARRRPPHLRHPQLLRRRQLGALFGVRRRRNSRV